MIASQHKDFINSCKLGDSKIAIHMKNVLINTKKILEILITFKFSLLTNPLIYLKDFLGLIDVSYILETKDQTKYKLRGETTDKWVFQEIVLKDDYKINNLELNNGIIIDLGANIGVFSIYSSKLGKNVKVFAYEPEPKNFSFLQENIALNDLSNKIYPYQLACSNNLGTIQLFIDASEGGHSLLPKNAKSIEVNCTTLQQIVLENNIDHCDLLKIDIEGAEYGVLYNVNPVIFEKISRINMEYHNSKDNQNNNGESLKTYLERQGYRVRINESIDKKIGYLYCDR